MIFQSCSTFNYLASKPSLSLFTTQSLIYANFFAHFFISPHGLLIKGMWEWASVFLFWPGKYSFEFSAEGIEGIFRQRAWLALAFYDSTLGSQPWPATYIQWPTAFLGIYSWTYSVQYLTVLCWPSFICALGDFSRCSICFCSVKCWITGNNKWARRCFCSGLAAECCSEEFEFSPEPRGAVLLLSRAGFPYSHEMDWQA